MISKVLKYNYCSGCGICQSIIAENKIKITLDQNGFYRPSLLSNLNINDKELFSKVCPGLIVKNEKHITPNKDIIWGGMFSCFIGASVDDNILNEASSGGGISTLLINLLESKKISAVIHIGASKIKPYLNEVKISTTREEILENANSRYSPSSPLVNIIEDLQKFENYAFVGKPCDIAALRQYSNFNQDVKNKIKYYISFFCAGVPSMNATLDILQSMAIKPEEIKDLSYRKDGWPGYFKITNKNSQIHKLPYSLTWNKFLGPKVQFRCKICADGIGHLADVVCADAWDNFDDKGYPTFKNAPGKSLIISRTQIGEDLIQEVLTLNLIKNYKIIGNYREIDKMQPGQLSKKINFLPRILAILIKYRITPKFSKAFYLKAAVKISFKDFIFNFLGTLRRTTKNSIF